MKRRGSALLFLCLSALSISPVWAETPRSVFRFHLFKEPESLDPLAQKSSSGNYLTHQIFAPLLRYRDGKIQAGLATLCLFTPPRKWTCTLRKNLQLSDGSPLVAGDFVAFYRRIAGSKSPLAAELFALKNAKAIFAGHRPPTDLGVRAPSPTRLEFELETPDAEFDHRLTNPLLTPFRGTPPPKGATTAGDFATSGAFQFASWSKGQKIRLEPNLKSPEGHKDRPPLEVLFVSEDTVALKLYETGELDFNRRLPTAFLPQFENSPELLKIDQVRFDYFGFSPRFRKTAHSQGLIRAFTLGLPYDGLGALFRAKPRPGCFGLPAAWTAGQICYDQNLEKAKTEIDALKKVGVSEPGLNIVFSQNVDDHRRALEWLQAEMARAPGLRLRLDAVETKLMLARFEKGDMDVFRRGLAPDRPTCAAVLESFLPGAPENYLGIDDAKFVALVEKLRQTVDFTEKTKLCREAVLWLRDQNVMIPTGPIYFSLLLKKKWQGLSLTELNQLDLKDLHLRP